MADLLFLDANWDFVTEYLFSFRVHFLATHKQSHTAHHLKSGKVVQPEVDRFLRHNHVVYISGAGHGSYEAFKGFQDAIIWAAGTKLPSFHGKIVHLVSCKTGRQLGPAMMNAGARAFWGYQEDFLFIGNRSSHVDRYSDPRAKSAIYMDLLIDIGILQSKSADDIYQEVRNHVNREISNLGLFDFNRVILRHNFRHLVHLGDRHAKI